jgi:RimJ/RimL family protein N-acetyltransferase
LHTSRYIKKGKTCENNQVIGIELLYDINFVHAHNTSSNTLSSSLCYYMIYILFNGKSTLGLLVDKSFQSNGYGKESTNLLLEFAFNILNLNNVMLY